MGVLVFKYLILFVFLIGCTNLKKSLPKFKPGQCAGAWFGSHVFEAKEEWEVTRILRPITTVEILKIGKEKYLVNTHYSKDSPAPFRPNESQWISEVDKYYELIDCKDVDSILN